ncbi:MAG: hypothetical protein MRJ68_16380 [Nitrospira sp.]|nr:hypothetical protein [Nitrospira sp.]
MSVTNHQELKAGRFGFLPIERTISFSGGALVLLDNYQDSVGLVNAATNADGFVYPPIERMFRAQPKILDGQFVPEDHWDWAEVPKTERPAHLHRLPASHELRLQVPLLNNDIRKNDGAFLMYLAGYLFGYRLQFFDWWLDGRINMKSSHNINVSNDTASKFFSGSYTTWTAWPLDTRRHFTNILYMNSRSELYEWDWERFMITYMVFDACYKHATGMMQVQSCTHKDRLKEMCGRYGLYYDGGICAEIVDLRNRLFHEALWDGGQPCSSGGQRSFMFTECLRGINQRLIPAMLGYYTKYIGSRWDCLGTCGF